MTLVSQAFEWVRALLFGTRAAVGEDSRIRPDQPTPTQAPAYRQSLPVSPVMISALLTLGRLHRAKRAARRRQGGPRSHTPAYAFPPALHSGELMGPSR